MTIEMTVHAPPRQPGLDLKPAEPTPGRESVTNDARPVAAYLLALAGLLLPWNGLVWNILSAADLAVVLLFLALVSIGRLRLENLASPPSVLLLAVIAVGGVNAAVVADLQAARFLSTSGLGALMAFIGYSSLLESERRRVLLWWTIGVGLSVFVGLGDPNPWNGRISGLATHPNMLGLTIAMAVPGLLVWSTRSAQGAPWSWAPGPVLMIIYVFGALQSGSRTALVVSVLLTIATAGIYLRARGTRLKVAMVTLVAALATFILATTSIVSGAVGFRRLIQTGSSGSSLVSEQARAGLLAEALQRLEESPIAGSGLVVSGRAHALYIELAAAFGIVGVFVAVGLVLYTLVVLRRWVRLERGMPGTWADAAALLAVAGYLVFGLTDTAFWDRHIWAFMGLMVGAFGAGSRYGRGAPKGGNLEGKR